MRTWAVIVACVVASVSAGAYFVIHRYAPAFPDITPGVYVGLYTDSNTKRAVPWVVARGEGDATLGVFVGDVRIPAQRAAVLDPTGRTRLPLIISGSEARLRFTGSAASSADFAGEFSNPISGESGVWTLARAPIEDIQAALQDSLTRWFVLGKELDTLEGQIRQVQETLDLRKSSVDSLDTYVGDGYALKRTADQRLGRADSEIESTRSELADRQSQLDRAIRDFDLSQRISPQGKLVYLSRQTIQRESRWIDLTLKLMAPETSPGFQQALDKAERVRELKRKIALEREAALKQGEKERYRGSSDATNAEEEFYGQLQ